MEQPPRERKRRKWDVSAADVFTGTATVPAVSVQQAAAATAAALFPTAAIPQTTVASAAVPPDPALVAQGAAAIVQKINQDLVAKGLLPAHRLLGALPPPEVKEIFRDVTINNAPPQVQGHISSSCVPCFPSMLLFLAWFSAGRVVFNCGVIPSKGMFC